MMGWPVLMSLSFGLLPFGHDAIQIWLTMSLSMIVIALSFWLTFRLAGPIPALVAAGVIGFNQTIIQSSVLGLTEELYVVFLLSLLLVYSRLRQDEGGSWKAYLLMAGCSGWMTVTRMDASLVIIPLFLVCLKREVEKGKGLPGVGRGFLLISFPAILLILSGWYQYVNDMPSIYWRAGRAIFFQEFFRGHVPWDYMFYTEMSMGDWFFDHHTFPQAVNMVLMSSIRTILALGEAVGGQCFLGFGIFGIYVYVMRNRDWLLPTAIPLSILTIWVHVSFQSESDMFRYIVRALPLLIVFITLGWWEVNSKLLSRLKGNWLDRFAPQNISILLALTIGSTPPFPFPRTSCCCRRFQPSKQWHIKTQRWTSTPPWFLPGENT